MLLGSSCDQSQVDILANSIVRKAQNIYIVFYILGNAQKSKRVKKALQKKTHHSKLGNRNTSVGENSSFNPKSPKSPSHSLKSQQTENEKKIKTKNSFL